MPAENPYQDGSEVEADSENSRSVNTSPERAAYNVVSDTVTGLNVRKNDNKFQAIFIGISVLIWAMIGTILAVWKTDWELPWFGGAMIGAFAGLVLGVFASGIFLMVYRAIMHMQGRHD